jgi:hypothetical protein
MQSTSEAREQQIDRQDDDCRGAANEQARKCFAQGWVLGKARRLPAPRPPGKTDGGQPQDASLQPAAAAGFRVVGVEQLPIGVQRLTRLGRRRPRTGASFRRRNPAADVGERFRAANGTGLRIVDLVAVKAEAGDVELHPTMITARPDTCEKDASRGRCGPSQLNYPATASPPSAAPITTPA